MQLKHGCLESSILSTLWNMEAQGEYKNSVKNVYDFLAKNEIEKRAYTTIKTVMDRLYEKKILLRYKEGKKFYYRTAYSKMEIVTKSLCDISNKYFNGDLIKLSQVLQSILSEQRLVNI